MKLKLLSYSKKEEILINTLDWLSSSVLDEVI